MTTPTAAVLEPLDNARVALEAVSVDAVIRGLLAETTVIQTYRNLEEANIEAVYTFPLPLDAVLLEMTFELKDRTLRGVVLARQEAEASYEEAIEDGDTAVLLEQAGPGLYTVNVGNLLAGEQAVIRFRYAELLRWQGDSLRFHLPTTVAPRYGDPAAAGLAPHQIPEHVLTTERGFSLKVTIQGILADAAFECPSHPVGVADEMGRRELHLAGGSALMDRDFILVLRKPQGLSGEALVAKDKDAWVVLASFNPVGTDHRETVPRCVKLVVDCSGSMSGDSIAQARNALSEITGLLEPRDHFNIIAFGSSHHLLFPNMVPATPEYRRAAGRFIDELDANLGGTEMAAALSAAYRCGGPAGMRPDILLITDGEIWDDNRLIEAAHASGHRHFTVGVGSAVSEALVRQLAAVTGGAVEQVSPREGMAERIVRHFRRMAQPHAESANVHWAKPPQRQVPGALGAVYAGDTLHVFGWLAEEPAGEVTLEVVFGDGSSSLERVTVPAMTPDKLTASDVLPRIAAWQRLCTTDEDEARDLAVGYQLVTEHTSCVLVSMRPEDEKADTIPALRNVPQVLAAGWGGMGSAGLEEWSAMEASPMLEASEALQRPEFSDTRTSPEALRDTMIQDAAAREDDALDEVNVYLAYERYDQAEQLILKAIAAHPENEDYHLKLLETHHSAQNLEGFRRAALVLRDVAGAGSPAISQAMGWWDELDPDSPLFDTVAGTPTLVSTERNDLSQFVTKLNEVYPEEIAAAIEIRRLADLRALGVPSDIVDALEDLLRDGLSEQEIIQAFLDAIVFGPWAEVLTRQVKRLIHKSAKASPSNIELRKRVHELTGMG